MRLPTIRRLLCRAGLHDFGKPRRVNGFRVRRCKSCRIRQTEQFPGPTWVTTVRTKRARRKLNVPVHEHLKDLREQERGDFERGLEPL